MAPIQNASATLVMLLSIWMPLAMADGVAYPSTAVEVGLAHENLDKGHNDWRAATVDIEHYAAPRETFYAGLRETQRFGLDDTEGKAGAYLPITDACTLNLEGSASGTHRVLPQYSLYAQLHRILPAGWGIAAGLRHNEYSTSGTNTLNLLAERYWGNYRAAYTLYLGKPEGASTGASHRVQLSYYYTDRSHVGLSLTSGREVESIGPGQVLTSDIEAAGLAGRHWLNRDWAVSYELGRQRQDNLYTRQGLYVGLRRQF